MAGKKKKAGKKTAVRRKPAASSAENGAPAAEQAPQGGGGPAQLQRSAAEKTEKAAAPLRERNHPGAEGRLRLAVGLLALAGSILAGFLTYSAWAKAELPFCGAESGCDLVQASHWSTLLGQPIALWGTLFYLGLLALVAYPKLKGPLRWRALWLLSWGGLAVSLYLTGVSLVVIKETCSYCLTSLGLASAIFALLLFWGLLRGALRLQWQRLGAGGFGLALAIVLVLQLAYHPPWREAGAGNEDPQLRGLAQHLTEKGALFYGAAWCPACAVQKGMFENSAHRLPYIECSPNGRNAARNPECVIRGVGQYPTWFLNGARHTGVLKPEELARRTGYDFPLDE